MFRFSLWADDARKHMFCRSICVDTCNRRLFVCIVLLAGTCSPPLAWGQRFAPPVAHPTSFRSPRLRSQSLQASLARPKQWLTLPFFRKPFHRHDHSSHYSHRSRSKRSGCHLHSMHFLRPLQISISARRAMARPISSRKRTPLRFAPCSPTSRRSFRPRHFRLHLRPRHLRLHHGRYHRGCRHIRSLICPLYHPCRLCRRPDLRPPPHRATGDSREAR